MRRDFETFSTFFPESGTKQFERRRRGKRRRTRKNYTYEERVTELDKWWDEHEFTTLLQGDAEAWIKSKKDETREKAGGYSENFYATAMETATADTNLLSALKDLNFRPITLASLGERLRVERWRMQDQVVVDGQLVRSYFDHVVDLIGTAKPNVDTETLSLLKARVRGVKLF